MSKYNEILELIDEMEDCQDVSEVTEEINNAYENKEISKTEQEDLWVIFEDEKLRVPLIDDCDWELMKESDPDLSDQ